MVCEVQGSLGVLMMVKKAEEPMWNITFTEMADWKTGDLNLTPESQMSWTNSLHLVASYTSSSSYSFPEEEYYTHPNVVRNPWMKHDHSNFWYNPTGSI